MAISSAAGVAGTHHKSFDVTATVDADTGAFAIAHGFGAAPEVVILVPLLWSAHASEWVLVSVDATNITVSKSSVNAGSGNAAAQLKVHATLKHSMVS